MAKKTGAVKGKKADYDVSVKNIRICIWNNKNRNGTPYVYGKIFRYRGIKDGGMKILDLNGREFEAVKRHLNQCEFYPEPDDCSVKEKAKKK